MNRDKEKILKCYADYETEYKPWITTDPLSTSFLLVHVLIYRLRVGGFSSITQIQREGLVGILVHS